MTMAAKVKVSAEEFDAVVPKQGRARNLPWDEREACWRCRDSAVLDFETAGRYDRADTGQPVGPFPEHGPCPYCLRGWMAEFGYGRNPEKGTFYQRSRLPWGDSGFWARFPEVRAMIDTRFRELETLRAEAAAAGVVDPTDKYGALTAQENRRRSGELVAYQEARAAGDAAAADAALGRLYDGFPAARAYHDRTAAEHRQAERVTKKRAAADVRDLPETDAARCGDCNTAEGPFYVYNDLRLCAVCAASRRRVGRKLGLPDIKPVPESPSGRVPPGPADDPSGGPPRPHGASGGARGGLFGPGPPSRTGG